MTRDYKNHIPAYRNQKPLPFRNRGVLIVAGIVGTLLVAVAGFVISGKKNTASALVPPPTPMASSPAGSAEPHSPAVPESPKKIEPRFTFYKILSEKEVIIPEHEVKTIRRQELASKSTAPTGRYYIQVGSFINQADAERARTQLVQIKIPARLEMIQVDNSTWFRVKVGPYATLNDVEQVRHFLRTHRVDSVVQKSNK